MKKFKEELFKAFFITKINEQYEGFKKFEFESSYNLFISDDYDYYLSKGNDFEVYLLGYCLDIRNGTLSNQEIVDLLSAKTTIDGIYEELEYINGRFTLVINDGLDNYISSDAISLKPVFYSEEIDVVSSHEYIIKKIAANKRIKLILEDAYKRGFLDLTAYEGIYKLSCNNELELPSYNQRRLFPLYKRKEQPYERAVNELIPYFDNTTDWIDNNPKKPVFSLTGGVDSRSSLAVLKPIINKVKSFTYLRPKKDLKNKAVKTIYTNDERIVESMSDNLNLNHEFFYFQRKKEDEVYYDYINTISSSNHSYPLSKYLHDNVEYQDALHIKSTVQALAKTTYPLELYKINNFSSMISGTLHWGSDKLRNSTKEEINIVYTNFLKRINLSLDDLKGYHILDIMYLESRMGHFQSIITQETDNTLEVLNLVNTRKLFEIMYSVPLMDRHDRKTHKAIIQHYWPILNQFGINTEDPFINLTEIETTSDKYKNEVINGIELVKTNNLSLTKNKGILQIKPEATPLLVDGQYLVSLVNISSTNKKLSITSTYKNENGRGNISLVINESAYDILDLNKTLKITVRENEQCIIKYRFTNNKKNDSWLAAAKLLIKSSDV